MAGSETVGTLIAGDVIAGEPPKGDLSGKVALVTGASRGIGRAIAVALAARGALVGVHYNAGADAAQETLAAVRAAGGDGFLIAADLGAPQAWDTLADGLAAALAARGLERFHILVNNAGVSRRMLIEEVDEAEFDRVLQVNLKAPFFLIRRLAPLLADGGRIINISSMSTRAAFAFSPVYAPSKAGLEALTRLLAVHYGPRGITVNAVLPGATATDMNPVSRDPKAREATAKTVALGRVGEPEDIARVVAFLASPDGGWVTGQMLDASGGQRL
ncbi:SDR family NAD(P)-dependent oxidoreductase [Azorhizobium doebereinerae]|uniref:SDR family NAD(P)-dependent oxidoreductase n=1 Tax=Azorhizobium doebereinerae TaxID=281091 RepID=UPI000418E57A|nr:SDR family oxidoreductase [Azorhizobium doebereinerae]